MVQQPHTPLVVPEEASELRHVLVRGHLIDNKYRVEEILGVGGIGIVVSATHLQLGERVALKILLPRATASPDLVVRFEREARAMSKLKSEHAVRVNDVGWLDQRTPYFVMEQLDGEDLANLLARVGALPVATAVDYVLQACEALAEAHALGMVHRDLKPSNLFLCRRRDGSQCIKLIDFGMTKFADTENTSLTRSQSFMGSPAYSSPEQLKSPRMVDARSDIWSLGVVLYELLTGALPFGNEEVVSVMVQITRDPPAPLKDRRSDVPDELEQIIMRCLSKTPETRFSNVARLASELSRFGSIGASVSSARIIALLKSAGASVPPPAVADGAVADQTDGPRLRIQADPQVHVGTDTPTLSEAQRTPLGTSSDRPSTQELGRRRWSMLASIVVVAGFAALGVWTFMRSASQGPLPTSTSTPAGASQPHDRRPAAIGTPVVGADTASAARPAATDPASATPDGGPGATIASATSAAPSANEHVRPSTPPTPSAAAPPKRPAPSTTASPPKPPVASPSSRPADDDFSDFGNRK